MNDGLSTLGLDTPSSAESFDRFLRHPPEQAARQILQAVLKNKRRLLIGNDAKIIDLVQRILPAGYQRLSQWALSLNRKRSG